MSQRIVFSFYLIDSLIFFVGFAIFGLLYIEKQKFNISLKRSVSIHVRNFLFVVKSSNSFKILKFNKVNWSYLNKKVGWGLHILFPPPYF